jgi:hypothetical protein
MIRSDGTAAMLGFVSKHQDKLDARAREFVEILPSCPSDARRAGGRDAKPVLKQSLIWCVLLAAVSASGESLSGQVDIRSLSFRYSDVTGIGKEIGVCRRDPSDVIRVGDTCYVYYTKVIRDELPAARRRLYPSGYPGTVWYAVSKDEGRTWDEQGQALGLGEPGAFDSFGVFTPNILAYEGKYWLYYTGVRPTPGRAGVFENNSTNDPTAIGVAVADLPDGPFKRVANNPVLATGGERQAFDSYRVHDACLVVRGGKV